MLGRKQADSEVREFGIGNRESVFAMKCDE
jgi:hypothetical protein